MALGTAANYMGVRYKPNDDGYSPGAATVARKRQQILEAAERNGAQADEIEQDYYAVRNAKEEGSLGAMSDMQLRLARFAAKAANNTQRVADIDDQLRINSAKAKVLQQQAVLGR
jgi:hypothetical protein